MNEALMRAMDYLDAEEVPNHPGFYAYHDRKPEWLIITTEALLAWSEIRALAHIVDDDDAYDIWCQNTTAVVVKEPWWTPEQQFAWRGPVDSLHTTGFYLTAPICRNESDSRYQRVTVDLTTGEVTAI